VSYKDVCVLIPTLNEEESIEPVIREFRALGYENILVVDGHSTDATVAKARAAGARIFLQSGSGKGQALKEVFAEIVEEYILLIDGDGTYLPGEAGRVLDPVLKGQADHVVGNRLENIQGGALKRLNMIGNKMINRFFAYIYRVISQTSSPATGRSLLKAYACWTCPCPALRLSRKSPLRA